MLTRLLRSLALCLLLATVAPAATVYLRTPGTAACTVTAATNATPIRMTVSDISTCGITEGATIAVFGVYGNLGANTNADANQQARKAVNVSGNSFDLQDTASANVAGTGAYTSGGKVGLATGYTLKSHPILYLDGAGGTTTTAISSGGTRATTANEAYKALLAANTSYNSTYAEQWGIDRIGEYGSSTAAAALRYLADGNTDARDAAIWGVQNVDQTLGTPACLESKRQCGPGPASSVMDYASQMSRSYAQAYSIVYGSLSSGDKTAYANFYLNDLPWTSGGSGVSGTSLDKPAWKVNPYGTGSTYDEGYGRVSVANGSKTVTCTGACNFATRGLVAGDIIFAPAGYEDSYSAPNKIASVDSESQLTLEAPMIGAKTNQTWIAGPSWADGDYGMVWHQKHMSVPGEFLGLSYPACEAVYGVECGLGSADNNLTITRLLGWYANALVICSDDTRGCSLAGQIYQYIHDWTYPALLGVVSGFSHEIAYYNDWRVGNILTEFALLTRNSLVGAPDPLFESQYGKFGAKWAYSAWTPHSSDQNGCYWPLVNSDTLTCYAANYVYSFALSLSYAPTSDEAKWAYYWLTNHHARWTQAFIQYNQNAYVWWHYLLVDTGISASATPTASAFAPDCPDNFGCASDRGKYVLMSRTGWEATDTILGVNGYTYENIDHGTEEHGGGYLIWKGYKWLMGGDAAGVKAVKAKTVSLQLGGGDNIIPYYPTKAPVYQPWQSTTSPDYAYAKTDVSDMYVAGMNVNRADRHVVHFKKSEEQEYIVEYTSVGLSSGHEIKGFYHLYLNSCGTPSSSECITGDRANKTFVNTQTGAVLTSKVVPLGTVAVDTDNASDTNGSYSGGAGYTWRYYVCASADGSTCNSSATEGEWAVVHKTAAMATAITTPESTGFRVIEIQDASYPKVAAFSQDGTEQTSFGVTTTHEGTAQYVVAGLAAGTYSYALGGYSQGTVTVTDGDNTAAWTGTSGVWTLAEGEAPSPAPSGIGGASISGMRITDNN